MQKGGHDISECYKLQNKEKWNATYKPKGNKEGKKIANLARDDSFDGDVLVITAGCVETNDECVLDTTYNFHMYPHKDWVTTCDSITTASSILWFDNSPSIKGIGFIQIEMFSELQHIFGIFQR